MDCRPIFLIAALSVGLVQIPAAPGPLIHTHAHNDYEHARPLLDALDHGFCSVEADIYFVDGQLLVAHERSAVQPARNVAQVLLDWRVEINSPLR